MPSIVLLAMTFLVTISGYNRRNRVKQVLYPVFACAFDVLLLVGIFVCEYYYGISDGFLISIAALIVLLILKVSLFKGLTNSIINDEVKKEQNNKLFYYYDSYYDQWFLKDKFVEPRTMLRWLSIMSVLISGFIYGIIAHEDDYNFFGVRLYPILIVIILEECYSALNGYSKKEYLDVVGGEDQLSHNIGQYFKLLDVLKRKFDAEYLGERCGTQMMAGKGIDDIVAEWQKSGDTVEKITAEFFNIHDISKGIDVDRMSATLHLMNRKNVVFMTPFYRDLGDYLILPMIDNLLRGKKILVFISRNSTIQDVTEWIRETVRDYCKMETLWRVGELDNLDHECEIGLLTYTQLYNQETINHNREFFNNVGFVLMLEPSLVINAGQVGLNIVNEYLTEEDNKPVYCVADRAVVGLVDTVSHIMKAEFVEVFAPQAPRYIYTGVAWNADGDFQRDRMFDKQTNFLGGGIEIASVALKNQIPKVTWYGETKAPLRDIKWRAGQSYASICKYIGLPIKQQSLWEKLDFETNPWGAREERSQFIIVEDEFCNLYGAIQNYISKGHDQIFVNVLSENYLFRDYMRCNRVLFSSNANVIPSLVPDYAKTERNVIIKLIIMMASRHVSEKEIKKEFDLSGIEYAGDEYTKLCNLIEKHTYAPSSIVRVFTDVSIMESPDDSLYSYAIDEGMFVKYFAETLKNAYYIVEEEAYENEYVDSKMFGHVVQSILPGQFVIYDGKYYQAKVVSPVAGVVLRRAADLYTSRKYYRQIRKYTIEKQNEEIDIRKVMDIEIARLLYDFSVETTGYLELRSNEDLRSARKYDFSEDSKVGNYTRKYRNKEVLRIHLPESTDRIRFTLCMLLQEVMRSVYPNLWQYIAFTTTRPEDIDGYLNYTVYELASHMDSDEYIYVFEDSEIDLGIIGSVEKNFMLLMEMVDDFLDWHFDKMKEPEQQDPVKRPVEIDYGKLKVKHSLKERINRLFLAGKREKDVKIDPNPDKLKPGQITKSDSDKKKDSDKKNNDNGDSELKDGPFVLTDDDKTETSVKENKETKNKDIENKEVENEDAETIEKVTVNIGMEAETPNARSESEIIKEIFVPVEREIVDVNVTENKEISDEDSTDGMVEVKESGGSEEIDKENLNKEDLNKSKDKDHKDSEKSDDNKQKNSDDTDTNKQKDSDDTDTGKKKASDDEGDEEDSEKNSAEDTEDSEDDNNNESDTGETNKSSEDNQLDRMNFTDPIIVPKEDENDIAHMIEELTNSEILDIDGTDIFENNDTGADELYFRESFEKIGILPIKQTRYQKECYLKYGFADIDNRIKIEELKKYLILRGFENNSIRIARRRGDGFVDDDVAWNGKYCSFCGCKLTGVSYDCISDGRLRCNECSSTAVRGVEEFRQIYAVTNRMMETLFNIRHNVSISVKIVDAKKIAKGFGMVYKPSSDGDIPRVVGYAQKFGSNYSILLENGSPRLVTIQTLVHEMTHIWQYLNWKKSVVKRYYPTKLEQDIVYEGMAEWVAVQYLYLIGEVNFARKAEEIDRARSDIYGYGFRAFCDAFPLVKDGGVLPYTPFTAEFPLIEFDK